jgi:hypothetical protein
MTESTRALRFPGELTDAVQALGRPTIHLTLDGYHHPRDHRYQKGKLSAEGYYEAMVALPDAVTPSTATRVECP